MSHPGALYVSFLIIKNQGHQRKLESNVKWYNETKLMEFIGSRNPEKDLLEKHEKKKHPQIFAIME